MQKTRNFGERMWQIAHRLPIPVALAALVIVYLWFRPFAFSIAMCSLLVAAICKPAFVSACKVEGRQQELVEAGSNEVDKELLERARVRVLALNTILIVSTSVCSAAALLAVLHWYK
jgi:hypothetical protein